MIASRRGSAAKRALFVVLFLLVNAFLFEMVLRIVFPVPEVTNFNRIDYSPVIHVPEGGKTYLSNSAYTWASEPDGAEFVHHLNLYGFRDDDWRVERPDGRERAVFIGDSLVEGYMSTDRATIPAGFARAAAERNRDLEAFNMGVGGADVAMYFRLIADAVPLFEPDYVFVIFYENDFAFFPEFEQAWLSSSLEPEYAGCQLRAWRIVEGIRKDRPIPRAWHSEPFPFVAPVPDSRNPWSSEKRAKFYERFVEPDIADAMKRGRFNPFTVNSYGVRKRTLTEPIDAVPHLTALKRFVQKHSARLFIVYIPDSDQVSDAYLRYHSAYSREKHPTSLMGDAYQVHARMLGNACTELGIDFLDLTPFLRRQEAGGERLFWNYDGHLKGEVYLQLGERLFEWFREITSGRAPDRSGPS